jgi:hypothetical protein
MRGRQRLLFFTAVAALVLVASTTAQAASVTSLFLNDPGFANAATDDSFEYLVDRNWNGIAEGAAGSNVGVIDVGDSLRGMFTITVVNSTLIGKGSFFTTEWTGVFQAKVTSKTATGAVDINGNPLYLFTFGPDAAFAEAGSLGVGGNAIVIFYEDATPDYADEYGETGAPATPDDGTAGGALPAKDDDVSIGPYGDEEAFIATASNGTPYWALGFTGAKVGGEATPVVGEGWAVTTPAPDDVNGPAGDSGLFGPGFTRGFGAGIANFGLNRIFIGGPGDAVGIVPQVSALFGGTVEFTGLVTIGGVNGINTPFEISDQASITFFTVPIPGAAWTGLAMLGLLGFVRFRRRAARIV